MCRAHSLPSRPAESRPAPDSPYASQRSTSHRPHSRCGSSDRTGLRTVQARRCRTLLVLPEAIVTGATPHRAASSSTEISRLRSSPKIASRLAIVTIPWTGNNSKTLMSGFLAFRVSIYLFESLTCTENLDSAISILLIFSFLFGIIGISGQLPPLIQLGKFPKVNWQVVLISKDRKQSNIRLQYDVLSEILDPVLNKTKGRTAWSLLISL